MIYTDRNGSENGDGTEEKPFKNFDDAVNAANDGDTILVGANGAYIGTVTGNELTPFVIDKSVVIKGVSGQPSIEVRRAGILLEADVEFKDVNLTSRE